MAVLGAHQRLDYVIEGSPWGDGSGGAKTYASNPNTYATCTGSINTNTLTLGSAILNNGDVFIIHQTQGAGYGQWQFNKVASGGGTTTITTLKPLVYAYVAGAQVIKFTMDTTINFSTNIAPTAWNGSVGGIFVFVAKTSYANTGGYQNTGGCGYRGGSAVSGTRQTGYCGESILTGQNTYRQYQAVYNGGGAGLGDDGSASGAGGAGGGHNGAGNNGNSVGSVQGGQGGISGYDSADGLIMNFGGGGGSGGTDDGDGAASGGGGTGGGIIMIFAKSVSLTNILYAYGGGGGSGGSWSGGGGGGAGGFVFIACETAALGTNLVNVSGGALGSGGNGGSGGAANQGKIAVHHLSTVTGSTTPSYNDQSDPTLKENPPGGYFYMSS